MNITFDQYIKNPTGGRARIVGAEQQAREVYSKRFDRMYLRVAGKIDYYLMKKSDESKYILYIKMPSESIDKLYYDVVIEFTAIDDVKRRINNLSDYDIKVFSNDPNFIFTYAYVFNKEKLLIPELLKKYDKYTFKTAPDVTNRYRQVGYVKSIYFAYLFYKLRGLDKKITWMNAAPINYDMLKKSIMDCNMKITQAQEMHTLDKKAKKLKKKVVVNPKDLKDISNKTKAITKAAVYSDKVSKVNREIMRRQKSVPVVKRVGYVKKIK